MNFLSVEEGLSRGKRVCCLAAAEDVGPVTSCRSPFFPPGSWTYHLDRKVITLLQGVPEGQSYQKEGSHHLGSNYS